MPEKKHFTLQELAVYTQSILIGDPAHLIFDVADLETATPQQASFFANPNYQQAMKDSQAGVVFISTSYALPLPKTKNYLLAKDPSFAFQQLIDLLYPQRAPSAFTGIHSTVVLHRTAKVAEGVTICPYAVIDEGAQIGQNSFIGASSYIGMGTIIGENCIIHPHVVIREGCVIGHRVILQPGVVIGSCGFGYITNSQGKHVKLSQVGNVLKMM
jgi:UDP-3-O-[3-hydroxymyristoyl] glucosamine N-acyltransferase